LSQGLPKRAPFTDMLFSTEYTPSPRESKLQSLEYLYVQIQKVERQLLFILDDPVYRIIIYSLLQLLYKKLPIVGADFKII
jgi:hypothetical protein